jgi:hypothetical protein
LIIRSNYLDGNGSKILLSPFFALNKLLKNIYKKEIAEKLHLSMKYKFAHVKDETIKGYNESIKRKIVKEIDKTLSKM